MKPIDNVLSRLDHKSSGDNQWDARCPCRNDDENPSLRVAVGKQEQVLMHCQRGGGCSAAEICESIGLSLSDLFPKESKRMPSKKPELTLQDTYKYYDAEGNKVMEVLRFVDDQGKKTFRQRKPSDNGGWDWSTSGIVKPLYRLPEVIIAKAEGKPIYVVEGEKDVHSLEAVGKVATTNPGGAGGEGQNKWMDHHTEALAGANVIIICDNDDAGYLHARAVYNDLTKAGSTVRVYKPGNYNDISDLLEAGGEIPNSLIAFDAEAPEEVETNPTNRPEVDTLIKDLHEIGNKEDLSDEALVAQINARMDSFVGNVRHEYKDVGTLVEWSPFLEKDVDLSYDWVIPNVLERQERVIVVAAEGAGKTTLARQVALLSSAGIHPFKRNAMPPVRTLMIDLENPERIIQRTARRIYEKIKWHDKHKDMDAHLWMKPDGVNLLKPEDRAAIEEQVAAIKPDILFFGPLYKAFIDPGGRTAESVSIEIARFLDYIRVTYDCALWIEHHAPLGSGGQRDLRPFGSAVWSRWSEFGIALAPDPTDPALIQFKHYRGQREAREWPELCKRGDTWPFEVVEFAQYEAYQPSNNEPQTSDENREFEEDEGIWG